MPDMVATPPAINISLWDKLDEKSTNQTLEEKAEEQLKILTRQIPVKNALLIDSPNKDQCSLVEFLENSGYKVTVDGGLGVNIKNYITDVRGPGYGVLVMPQTEDNMALARWAVSLESITAPVVIFYGPKADMKTANALGAYAVRDIADFEKLVKRLTPEDKKENESMLDTGEAEKMPQLEAKPAPYAAAKPGRITQQISVVRDALGNLAASAQETYKRK